jgi:penicillin-binding protein 2
LDYVKDASAGANFVHVTMGCKTGTAEAHGDDADPHAWFTVFAPFYNPEIAITVIVENGGQGSSVAGPIARDILKEYFEKKN